MKIKFWGVRGSIPTPSDNDFKTSKYGGNTPCVSIEVGDAIYIIDCGTGIRNLGNYMMGFDKCGKLISETAYSKSDTITNIFNSHFHFDHLQGLDFFKPLFRPNNKFNFYGFAGLEKACKTLSTEPFFPADYHIINPNIKYNVIDYYQTISFDNDFSVTSLKLNHPGGCMGYLVQHGDKKLVYATDNEHQSVLDEQLVSYIMDVDILVYDTHFTYQEYDPKLHNITGLESKIGWGHSIIQEGINIANLANIKTLAPFHYSPESDDKKIDDIAQYARDYLKIFNSSLQILPTYEGLEIEL